VQTVSDVYLGTYLLARYYSAFRALEVLDDNCLMINLLTHLLIYLFIKAQYRLPVFTAHERTGVVLDIT